MNREQAAEALAVLRKVVGSTQQDTALKNWGVIWMVQGTLIAIGFFGTNFLVASELLAPWRYLVLWGTVLGFSVVTALAFRKRRAGVRTFVETQLWSLSVTFVATVVLTAILNHMMGLRTFFLGPVISVLACAAFASMGSFMSRRWYAMAALMAVAAVLMAMFSQYQFYIFGTIWGGAQVGGGFVLHRARQKRLREGDDTETRLV